MRAWRELHLESETLALTLLPDKGAEIVSLVDRRTGAELLARLRPTPPDDGSLRAEGTDFDRWYAGGWQELLPNAGDACVVDGVAHAFHGESWARPWAVRSASATEATFAVTLTSAPLRVTKRLRLADDAARLELEETLEHIGTAPLDVLWGQHPAFGPPLVGAGARVTVPACRVTVVAVDGRSRLAPSEGRWPLVPDRRGAPIDISRVSGREARTHDLALLHDLEDGWYRLERPEADLGVLVTFDATLFTWLWMWQLYGDADDEPFRDGYCLALEPFTGPPGLAAARAAGEVLRLEPGERRSTRFSLEAYRPSAEA
ncbi:MAG: hypothetical protein AVDCRST_MAG79-2815 [uncultured Thermoleophilia bacterium]|uniref:Aldose 1-epimerase n=1 Tax=uncultured Thermoleophilia bacterium TaxID=1497501 RepID=A0A6J4ULM5_9ACTN|nr:MAG: hypothetical protein AVDCRST_MAG79-2815 [uncultured Thermoleophilia bacterium]